MRVRIVGASSAPDSSAVSTLPALAKPVRTCQRLSVAPAVAPVVAFKLEPSANVVFSGLASK